MTIRRNLAILALCTAALGWTACSDDKSAGTSVPGGCNPLAANWHCTLPFPSDFFMVDDPTMPSGRRVAYTEAALPKTDEGDPVDFTVLHPADGYSHLPQILALFPFSVDDSDLVFHTDDVTVSTGPDSNTVLMEADTGERILHFAELDPRVDDDTRRALIIRPMVRLKNGTRYIVAIRRLRDTVGMPIPPGEGFALLRDGEAGGHRALGGLVEHYEQNIFPQLVQAGVNREGLLLAWDFTTGTQEHFTRDMFRVRSLAMEAMEASTPQVTVTQVDENYTSNVFRRVRGTLTVPLFMESDRPGVLLHRDADGNVVQNGTAEANFTVLIPPSVGDASAIRPARLVQYGHGFFGSLGETEGGYVRDFSNRTGVVIIGVEWWGMCSKDVPNLVTMLLGNTSETLRFTDRVHQGMVNYIAVTYAAKTTLLNVPEMEVGGELVYDPDRIYYYGISQGHILGATYLSLSPHIDRGVLGVGGCAFPFMMFRSTNFVEYLTLIDLVMHDYLDQQLWVTMTQTTWDRMDPITYAPHLVGDLLPDGPNERTVLLQIGIGDPQVPNLASHIHGRAIGVTHLTPAPRTIPDLPAADGPLSTSALVEFDFHVPEPIPGTVAIPPEEGNEVHEGVRRLDAAIQQIDAFLRPGGLIQNFCDGPCDPE